MSVHPVSLFAEVLIAQISFVKEEDVDSTGNHYVVLRQARFPEPPKSDQDPDSALADLLRFCIPISDPWYESPDPQAQTPGLDHP